MEEEDIALRRDGWERDASQASIWKEQLREMMAQTLLPKGFSPSFPTSDNLHVALGLTKQGNSYKCMFALLLSCLERML